MFWFWSEVVLWILFGVAMVVLAMIVFYKVDKRPETEDRIEKHIAEIKLDREIQDRVDGIIRKRKQSRLERLVDRAWTYPRRRRVAAKIEHHVDELMHAYDKLVDE